MTVKRPIAIALSDSELALLQESVWVWEDSYRSSRFKAKAQGRADDVRHCDRKIAALRNLKARLYRVKAAS
ncbi:hypothetical protein SAMN02745157_1449 [Kaistia soli DSM 19436]|uniref:Uncharacterized protein n=1 Tax=Kaistia soli DSM 19436 TaxID=1122133 RepID=A0A1M4Y8G8_9HYPH|nr:hypothetical protein SAMN02745157_1449 [Kaistia soli DSM 19436]